MKPELEFTGSPALLGVPSAADDGNNEKCTYSTLGAMNKKAPEKQKKSLTEVKTDAEYYKKQF